MLQCGTCGQRVPDGFWIVHQEHHAHCKRLRQLGWQHMPFDNSTPGQREESAAAVAARQRERQAQEAARQEAQAMQAYRLAVGAAELRREPACMGRQLSLEVMQQEWQALMQRERQEGQMLAAAGQQRAAGMLRMEDEEEEDVEEEWWQLRRARRAQPSSAAASDPPLSAAGGGGGSGAQRQQQQSGPLPLAAGGLQRDPPAFDGEAAALAAVAAAQSAGLLEWPAARLAAAACLPDQGEGAGALHGGRAQPAGLFHAGSRGWGAAQVSPQTASGAPASLGSGTSGAAPRMVPVSELGADEPPGLLESPPSALGKRRLVSLRPRFGLELLFWRVQAGLGVARFVLL